MTQLSVWRSENPAVATKHHRRKSAYSTCENINFSHPTASSKAMAGAAEKQPLYLEPAERACLAKAKASSTTADPAELPALFDADHDIGGLNDGVG